MGLHIGNGVSLDAADDAGDVPHRRNVRVSDVPCDGRTAPELRQRIVVQIHGRDFGPVSRPCARESRTPFPSIEARKVRLEQGRVDTVQTLPHCAH